MQFLFKIDDRIEVYIEPVTINDEDSGCTTTDIFLGSKTILRIHNMLE